VCHRHLCGAVVAGKCRRCGYNRIGTRGKTLGDAASLCSFPKCRSKWEYECDGEFGCMSPTFMCFYMMFMSFGGVFLSSLKCFYEFL